MLEAWGTTNGPFRVRILRRRIIKVGSHNSFAKVTKRKTFASSVFALHWIPESDDSGGDCPISPKKIPSLDIMTSYIELFNIH